jgi:hypothetical protein
MFLKIIFFYNLIININKFKEVGDFVKLDELVAIVETDKV